MDQNLRFQIHHSLASTLSSVGGGWGNNNMVFCDLFFRSLNISFNKLAHHYEIIEETDTRKLKFFFKTMINEEVIENFIYHPSLKKLFTLFPLIQDDLIITQKFGDISEFDPSIHFETYEKSTNLHKQFNKEYSKCIENFTISKGRRTIDKLCGLLWTVRSNLAHGSKVDLLGKLERNVEVCDIIFHVLFNLMDAVLNFSTYQIGVYGELRKNGSFHNRFMNNMNFLSESLIRGTSWYEEDLMTEWVDVRNGTEEIPIEVYRFQNYEELRSIDRIEMAYRVFVPYFDDKGIHLGYCWVYSRSKQLNLDSLSKDISKNNIEAFTTNKSRSELIREKCKAYMISIFMIEKTFSLKKYKNYKKGKIDFKFENFEIKYNQSIPLLKKFNEKSIFYFEVTEEFINQINFLKKAFKLVWGNNSDGFIKFENCAKEAIECEYWHFESLTDNPNFNPNDVKIIEDANVNLLLMLFEYFKAETCKICNDEEEVLINEVNALYT